jgi:hypothetical protein
MSFIPILAVATICSRFLSIGVPVGFEGVTPNEKVPGWTSYTTGEGKSDWLVVVDPTAPGGSHVLRQAAELSKSSFPLFLWEGATPKDGWVEVKFKTVSGKIDQAAGVVWRALDAQNYYVCRANALEDNVVLYKVQDGRRTALDIVGRAGGYGVSAKVAPSQWQTLRVEFSGSRFKTILTGKTLFEVEDSTFRSAGRTGLWTKADSVTLFDDFNAGPP